MVCKAVYFGLSDLGNGVEGFGLVCVQEPPVALLPLQQVLGAPQAVLQLRAPAGLHHQPLLHSRVVSPRLLVAVLAADVRVLEGLVGRGAGGRGGGGSAELLQSGRQHLTVGPILLRRHGRWHRVCPRIRVSPLPGPLCELPGLAPETQVWVGLAPKQGGGGTGTVR